MENERFEEIFKDENYKETVFEKKRFENCKFINCNFLGADIKKCSFVDCIFDNSNFSMVKLSPETKIQNSSFVESKIVGINFSLLSDFLTFFDFKNCLLKHCNFSDLKLKNVKFTNCLIDGCDFMNTDLNSSSFKKSRFIDTFFENSDLQKSNFLGAEGFTINPTSNKLYGAKFNKSEVFGLLKDFGIKFE